MIDLRNYLLPQDDYAILKMNKAFPQYVERSDVDILCKNAQDMANKIKERHNGKLIITFINDHIHLDYYESNRLNLRFDLFESTKIYKNVCVEQKLFDDILQHQTIYENRNNWNWIVPSLTYDIITRYIEYLEYPEKLKHLEYYNKHRNGVVDSLISEYVHKKETK